MDKLLRDFPSGPLDRYRKKASFDWKKMKLFLETADVLEYQGQLYEEVEKRPVFSSNPQTPILDEIRHTSLLRMFELNKIPQLSFGSQLDNLRKPLAAQTVLFQIDPSMSIKHSIAFGMFVNVLQSLGTARHSEYLNKAMDHSIIGAYCLTEIGHGSNAKQMQTTATYDKSTQEFVLHSANFEAAKCWAGLLGQIATHAIVYAQLITPDGVNHSLHPFIVAVRDPKTMLPYPGIIVGDMGEKIGLNGIDNGFLMFKQYRIPRTCLLNKTGDVTEDGKYVTQYRDPNKRYGASLGALSVGRVFITGMSSIYSGHALTIAIRYAAVRKQFGSEDAEEMPILEYQSHQYRLIPYLSATYVLKIFATYLFIVQHQFSIDSITGQNKDKLPELGLELHAISSASKPVAGWTARDAVQECREACAGHGYLKAAGIGDIKNNHDANCTYEGENHVLIQQTSNWLLKFWPQILQGQTITFPLGSVDFLTNALQILRRKCNARTIEEFIMLDNMLDSYQWLVCYLLKTSYEKCEFLTKNDKLDSFWAKNESQVFYCKNLSIVYVQHFMMQIMHTEISKATDPNIKAVLTRLLALYGVWSLEKHTATFYKGGYATDSVFATLLQESALQLCNSLKNDAVALVDVIAPPDFIIKSVLGKSDGQVYKHLEEAMLHNPDALERPKWWKDAVDCINVKKSKL